MASSLRGPSLKDRQRQERQALILQAAADLLAERGYHEMSLDEIAARVGISKGTIYLHFPSKEDLVIALFEQGMTGFVKALDQTLNGDGSPREKLARIIEHVIPSMACDPHTQLFSAVMQQPELLSRLAQRRESMRQAMEEPRRRLAEVIDQGKASGDFDPQLPTPLLLAVFSTILSPHIYRNLAERDGLEREQIAAGLRRFLFKGISPCPHAPHPVAPDAP